MSWHFSRALAEAYSEGNLSGGAACALSSTTDTPEALSWQDKTTGVCRRSRFGMMSEPLTDDLGEAVLMWCLEDSLAKTSRRQERERESPESDQGFGVRWRALSVRFDPVSCGWKTAHSLLEEDLDWSFLTLPKWGSLHAGELWARDTPALLTAETESGSWPTPMAQDAKHSGWALSGPGAQDKLPYAVIRSKWPTPTASEAKNNGGKCHQDSIQKRVGGMLNPTWVEWLMGWPLGWTDCGASATDKYRQWFDSHGRRSNALK